MAHDHQHDNETYYLDQLCMIALCGAFAAAGIVLYLWQKPILVFMFGTNSMFHDLIFWSGICLLLMVLVRAATLWISAGRLSNATACDHDHNHEHGHDCGHDHDHPHDHAHGHDHDHEHGHDCGHDHGHEHNTHAAPACPAGHEHGFAPWRYVVLLIPIILFLLGLPNQGPKARARDVTVSQVDPQAAPALASLIAAGPHPLQQVILAATRGADSAPKGMDFKMLYDMAEGDPDNRRYWTGKNVSVVGQYAPNSRNDGNFAVVRFRIQCCGADAVPYPIAARCNESLAGVNRNQWVEVSGRVYFQPDPRGGFRTVLIVPRRQNIVLTNPDPNPYIQ